MGRVLLALLCVFGTACAGWQGGLRVRFGITNIGVDYFIDLPKSVSAATGQGWTQAARVNQDPSRPDYLSLYCHASYTICVFYDDTEYVAGVQVAFHEGDFQDAVYDWEVQGFSLWTPGNGETYWATQQYFVSKDFLTTSAEERVAARNPNKMLQAGGVWVSGIGAELVEISGNTTGILANGFTEQACIPFMGVHYYRDMTPELECNDKLFPWFGLTDTNQELIATGLVVYGKLPEKPGDWFERPARAEVQMIVPRGPECLYDLAANPGLVTMHVYYIDEPWTFAC